MSLHKIMQDAKEGGYINQPFDATVSYPEQKEYQGRPFYVAKLTDGQTSVRVAGGIDFRPFDGQRVNITSPYKKPKAFVKWKETYNGTPKLSIGDGVVVTPAGNQAAAVDAHSKSMEAFPQESRPAATHGSGGYPGVTVGMAINKAVDICIAEGNHDPKAVYNVASSLVRMAEKMQAGILAPKEEPAQDAAVRDNDGLPF